MRILALTCLISVFATATSLTAAEDWPEFRGPTADGHAHDPSLPVEWSGEENITWKAPIHGRAWSSPVIWGDQIWLTTATADGKQLSGICIDKHSGEVLHDLLVFEVAEPREIHKFNSYSSPTPCIDSQHVYLSWGSYGLACLDRQSAEVVWSRRDLECNHYRGPGSSPILFEDMLICHYDGFDYQYVVALDKSTGDTLWKTHRPHNFGTDDGDHKKAYATPIVIDVEGKLQLISPTSKGTFAYDLDTGEEIWRIRYDSFSTAERPLYGHGLVYISTGFGKSELIAVDPTGTGDVTDTHVRWIEKKGMPSKPSPLLIDELIYVIHDQGVASCLDALTGETVWQARVGGNFSASPLYSGKAIYFFSEEGTTTVIRPGREYEVLAENTLADGIMASPAVSDGALFLRTTTHLYRIEDE